MKTLNQIRQPIHDEINRFEPFFRNQLRSNIPLLSLILNYILRYKGKQIRPLFVFLSAQLCGKINSSTYTAATLVELLHTATLIHDDVVDHSYLRRGVFSIHALWHSKIAVLVGDYLLAKGLLIALENNEYSMLKIISTAVKDMSEGELLQVKANRNNTISEEIYFEIISKKTASLIAACTSCGALSSNATPNTIDQMYRFGLYIGIAFQIKDDLLDFTGTNITGKPKGNDIKNKKLTLPLIYALKKSNKNKAAEIIRAINQKQIKKYTSIVNFVKESGGIDYANYQMNNYKEKALTELNTFPDSPVKTSLHDLVDFVINRNH